jgi:hypothetical protein
MYIGVLATHGAQFSSDTFLYADAPEAAYLGAGIAAGHTVVLPAQHSEILPTALAGWLLALPGGHVFVQLLAPGLALVLVAVLCLTVRLLRHSWFTVMVATGVAGPIALFTFMFPTAHVFALLGVAILAWALVCTALRRLSVMSGVLVTAAAGLMLLGDEGFAVYGVLPLLTAGLVASRLHNNWRAFRCCAIIAAGTVAVAAALHLAQPITGMNVVLSSGIGATTLDLSRLSIALPLALHSFAWLATGGWYNSELPIPWVGLSLLIGCAVPLVAPMVLALRAQRRRRYGGEEAVIAYCAFWAAADVFVLLAYLALGLSESPQSAYYLIPCLLSAGATLPLGIVGPRSRWAARGAASGVAAFAALGLALLPALTFAGTQAPLDGQRVLSVLRAQHLTHGYADYWTSHPLTWLSGEGVHVFPVNEHCSSNPGAVCKYPFSDDAWYRTAGSTFLILRTPSSCVDIEPRSLLGAPLRTISVDRSVSVLVYDYDIATRFSAANERGCFP